MGRKHTKEEILAGGLETALQDGLSQLTYGRLAKRLGIPDRTVVYYFPTKNDLVAEVVGALGIQLQVRLAEAFTEKAADHLELARVAWPILTTPEAEQTFALFFEANGLAAVGRAPYRELVPKLVNGWIEWAARFIEGPSDRQRREAETAVVLIDGLLLMRLMAGPESAGRAAQNLGIV